jgi:predicted dithiol-disulfide oxidoreductase (DUF899 family)
VAQLTHRTGKTSHPVVSRSEWLAARKALLVDEKAFFHDHDRLKEKRRALPWVLVDKPYRFRGPNGAASLSELFGPHRQLLVYHFMFNPKNESGCAHCSFWSDHYDGPQWHLPQRDTRFVAISRAPLTKLRAFQRRMGWRFPWYSSGDSDFNYDFHASFTPELIASGQAMFNYAPVPTHLTGMADREGLSAFYRDDDGAIYHTYSTFARGIDLLNTTYNLLDLTAKGRDEDPSATQSWVRHHDRYETAKPKAKKTGKARRPVRKRAKAARRR